MQEADAGPHPDAGPYADAGPDAPLDAADDAMPAAMLQGRVIFDSLNGVHDVPAGQTPIGVVGGDAMTTTGDDGSYALAVPSDESFVLLANFGGAEISVQSQLVVPPGGAKADLHVIDIDKYVGTIVHLGGQSKSFDTGAIAVRFVGSTQGGYGAAIDATHDGAFVLLDPAGEMSSTTTVAAGDTVYFYNVAPGTTKLTLTSPAGQAPCVDARAPGSVSYPVTATTMTEIVLDCSGS